MNAKTWIGLLLVAASYGQLLFPRRWFAHPTVFFHGYPIVAGNLLAIAAAYSTLGVILIGEGVCQRVGAPSLLERVTRSWRTFGRFLLVAAAAGLAMEALGQWLAKLWIYPYWTVWFYGIVVLPGFAFYWTAIAESYLAVKAVLDSWITASARPRETRFGSGWGLAGAGILLATAVGYLSWYSAHGGYFFANTTPATQAPPFAYVLLAFLGALLLAESVRPTLFASLRRGYWTPVAAILISSVVTSLLLETLNEVNHFWAYVHFPRPDLTFAGVQLSMVAMWPLQYLTFLLLPSLLMPSLADLFWRPARPNSVARRAAAVLD
jgi:hypothetical protein